MTVSYLPEPYYRDDCGELYCGDARKLLPLIERADLVNTDPPYNVGKDYGTAADDLAEADYKDFMAAVVKECLRIAQSQFWVAPRYKMALWTELLPNAHLIVIRRGAAGLFRSGWSDQFETALAIGKPNKCIPDLWSDIRLKSEGYYFREETYGHPGYTPSGIFARACNLLSEVGRIVIEPFAGTGTSLVVAKEQGRQYIGIEINPAYCEVAAKRLRTTAVKPSLIPEQHARVSPGGQQRLWTNR